MISRRQLIVATGASVVTAGVAGTGTQAASAAPLRHRRRLHDLAARPAVVHEADETLANPYYRLARWSCDDLQLTYMSIPVGGDIGLEMHEDVDQFIRIESGRALVTMGSDRLLDYVREAGPGDAVCIPSGTWHNVVNVGDCPLKVYSLYGPQQHPIGTLHPTQPDEGPVPSPAIAAAQPVGSFTTDPGAVPFVIDVEAAAVANTAYRTAAWTSDTLQLTLMSIPARGDVGLEMHDDVDQFLRVEEGHAKVYFGSSRDGVRLAAHARAGDAILVPSGTWHNVVNASRHHDLKLYSVYGPQQHPRGTVQATKPLTD